MSYRIMESTNILIAPACASTIFKKRDTVLFPSDGLDTTDTGIIESKLDAMTSLRVELEHRQLLVDFDACRVPKCHTF